jgi:hypothetical protein
VSKINIVVYGLPSIILLTIIAFLLPSSLNMIDHRNSSAIDERYFSGQSQANKSTSSTNNNATEFLTYENSTLGIRMLYPSNWTIEHFDSNVSFVPPDGFESLVLSVSKLPTYYSLIDEINVHIKKLDLYRPGPMGPMGRIIELTPTLLLDGKQAYRFVYEDVCMPDLTTCMNLQVWIISDDKIYRFHHVVMGSLDPVVETMIHSFRIVD